MKHYLSDRLHRELTVLGFFVRVCVCMPIWLRCAQRTTGVLTLSVQGWWTREKGSWEVIQKPLEFKYPELLLCASVQGNSKPTGSPTYRVQSGGLQNPLCNETADKSIESEQIQRGGGKKAPGCSGCPVEPCTFGMVRPKKKRREKEKKRAQCSTIPGSYPAGTEGTRRIHMPDTIMTLPTVLQYLLVSHPSKLDTTSLTRASQLTLRSPSPKQICRRTMFVGYREEQGGKWRSNNLRKWPFAPVYESHY